MRNGLENATVGRAALRLLPWLFLTCVVGAFQPRIVPPGNVWSVGDTLESLLLLTGAYWVGRHLYHPWTFLTYGLLGGVVVGSVCLPDSRDYFAIEMGLYSIWTFIVRYCACVAILGLACRTTGKFARRAQIVDPTICTTCSYNLTGNVSGSCPECGTTISSKQNIESGA